MNEPNRKRKESAIEHRENDTRKRNEHSGPKISRPLFSYLHQFLKCTKTLSSSSRFLFEIIVDSNRKLSGNNRQEWQKLVLHHICRTMNSF